MIGNGVICCDSDKVTINTAVIGDIVCIDVYGIFGNDITIVIQIAGQLYIHVFARHGSISTIRSKRTCSDIGRS